MSLIRLLLAFSLLFAVSCGTTSREPEKQYLMRGEVVQLDRTNQVARINHEKIEGWMDAMTMEFPVKDKAEFDKLAVGDRITAIVYVRDLEYYIGKIEVVTKAP
ncbi:MAG: copper-binding protein [Bryobacteraceae bacterium]|nr:copper-binding protein [Bryobacterales bacterium]MEB2362153.1 copper-binding protein [Bryobacterales bacterium]NUN00030.1 copper-binding protein [Bryobacteraceae bacterium]